MDKSKILACIQGSTTAIAWSFGAYWSEKYIAYPNLLAIQAVSGGVFAVTSIYANEEYYDNMEHAYKFTAGSIFAGKMFITLKSFMGTSATYTVQNIGGERIFEKTVDNAPNKYVKISDFASDIANSSNEINNFKYLIIDFIQAYALPIVSSYIREYFYEPIDLNKDYDINFNGENSDNIII